MTLPPETVAALRAAAALRRDLARLVYVERHVEPRSEPPFVARSLVVVTDDLSSEAGPAARRHLHGLVGLLAPALPRASGIAFAIPSPAGLQAATRGGEVVYERGA